MSTKHIRTTADLVRFGASLKIECGNCGAARTHTGTEIVRSCDAVSIGAVATRLRCSLCGKAHADRVGFTFANCEGFGHGARATAPVRFVVTRFQVR